jgi:alpha-glucosidase
MARQDRHSDDWFIGAVTNEDARDITIPLSFLGEGEWTATIYADAPDADWQSKPYATTIETRKVSAKDTIYMRLATGGGCAIRFERN